MAQANASTAPDQEKLWGGRFTGGLDPLMEAYNESLSVDKVLYAEDIRGSIAWATANHRAGILTSEEHDRITSGLRQVESEWRAGEFVVKPGDEDIHTCNERRLGEIVGKEGKKLHTGRSRNDQVVTDMRLWLRTNLRQLETWLVEMIRVMAKRAEAEVDALMPGYTHVQRAQPVRWSHWIMAHVHFFVQDLERLREVIPRVNLSPLGCGALAGNSFGVDRAAIARELEFDGLIGNSMAAVADRDFVVESLQWASLLMNHVSRWAEDLILYSSAEFAFVQLADAYSTGSSLMPQKKNPDSLELLRGKSGTILGMMCGLMATTKALPTTYAKDLQESVDPMLKMVRITGDSLQIATGVISTLAISRDKMLASLSADMLATDLAEYLVRAGMPFRTAHHTSGKVVALAEKEKTTMDRLSFPQIQAISPSFKEDVMKCFDYEQSVETKKAVGGTSKSAVLEQIKHVIEKL